MTEKQLHALFETWKHRLGLDLWHTEIRVEPLGPDRKHCFMDVRKTDHYDAAIIRVQPWVLTGDVPEGVIDFPLTEESVEAKVVHEFLHLCLRDLQHAVETRLDGLLHRDVYTVFTEFFNHETEHTIESMAQALVRAWHE